MNIIVTNFENKSIKNNFIYLSYDIIQELSLNEDEKNIIKLTNIKDNNLKYFFSWKGGIIENKLKTSELSKQYSDMDNQFFYIEKIKDNNQIIEKLSLIPLTNKDYNLIENNPDFFEENLINQIEIIFKEQILTFFFNDEIIFLKVENLLFEYGIISNECEVNIQYMKENIDNIEKIIEINLTKSNEIFSFKDNQISFLYKNSNNLLCDYCNLNNINKNKFPYLNGIWISHELNEKNKILDLPREILISTSFFITDLLTLKIYNFDKLYINNEDDNLINFEYLKIEFYSDENIIFENILQNYLPLILTPYFIYKFNNIFFRIIITNNNFYEIFNEKDKPIIILDFDNINKIQKIKSIELKTILNYTFLEKNKRYLEINKMFPKYIENKEINDLLKIIIYRNSIEIISYINNFFDRNYLTNILLIYLPNYFDEFKFSRKIMKLTGINEIKYFYLNFQIFSESLIPNKKIKQYFKDCYKYINNYSINKKIILIFTDCIGILLNNNINELFQKFLSKIKGLENIFSIIFIKKDIKITFSNNSYILYQLDESISNEDKRQISTIIKLYKEKEKLKNKTQFNFSSLCNFSKIKNTIYDIITLQNEYEKFFPNKKIPIKLSTNCLLIGPSGCGKTYLAKSIKDEFKINFYSIKITDIFSKYIGQSEEKVRNIFEKAKKNSPSVIFFDELESIVPQRGYSNSGLNDRIVNQFLTYLDGIEENKKIFIICASSNPFLIDNAILRSGRIDNIILCDYPNYNERIELIKFFIKQNKSDFDFKLIQNSIEKISKEIEFYSYADIYSGIYNCFYICSEENCDFNEDILIRGFKKLNKIINKDEVLLYKNIREKGIYVQPSSKIEFA